MRSVIQNIETNVYTPKTLANNIYKMVSVIIIIIIIIIIIMFFTGPHSSFLCYRPGTVSRAVDQMSSIKARTSNLQDTSNNKQIMHTPCPCFLPSVCCTVCQHTECTEMRTILNSDKYRLHLGNLVNIKNHLTEKGLNKLQQIFLVKHDVSVPGIQEYFWYT